MEGTWATHKLETARQNPECQGKDTTGRIRKIAAVEHLVVVVTVQDARSSSPVSVPNHLVCIQTR